ncbi:MAG: JDVT-CTERM system glutamic-type intramembrane protease [Pirellulales bacterium]
MADQVAVILGFLLVAGSMSTWLVLWRRFAQFGDVLAYEPRSRVPWRGLDVIIILIIYVALQGLAVAATMKIGGFEMSADGAMPGKHTPAILLAVTVANLVSAFAAVTWLRLVCGADALDLGWQRNRVLGDTGLGIVGLLAALVPVYVVQTVMFKLFPTSHPIITSLENGGTLLAFAVATIVVVVAAPIVEEIVFRLVFQGWLEASEIRWRRRLPPLRRLPRGHLPILASSTVFALVHFAAGPAPVALFFLALVLGYLYQRTHRIVPSIVMHAGFNATSMMMLALQQISAHGI